MFFIYDYLNLIIIKINILQVLLKIDYIKIIKISNYKKKIITNLK